MKTQFIGLIFLLICWTDSISQPLADLESIQLGDSLLSKVNIRCRTEHFRDNGALFYTRDSREMFYYSLILEEKKENSYLFKTKVYRHRTRYDLDYEDERDAKREEHRSYDSEYSTPELYDPYKKSPAFLNQEFSLRVFPQHQTYTIDVPEEGLREGTYFIQSPLNPEGISKHVYSLFFTKNQIIDKGNIEAELIPIQEVKTTIIKGKINNPWSDEILCSGIGGYGTITMLSDLDQRIKLAADGSFELRVELQKGSFLYFFHHRPDLTEKAKEGAFSFPLYVAPGEEIYLELDPYKGEELRFEGKNRSRHESFHHYYLHAQRSYNRSSVNFSVFYDYFNVESQVFSQPHELERKLLDELYLETMAWLEEEKEELGVELYQRLKTETIYDYLSIQLRKDLSPFSQLSLHNYKWKGLSLSENKDYYLDSLGISLDAVKASDGYTRFLKNLLKAQISDMSKGEFAARVDRFKIYHFARFAYRDFALVHMLKESIKQDLRHIEFGFSYGKEDADLLRPERDVIIEDFFSICNHQAYVDEINQDLTRIRKLVKGKPAPDMKLGEDKFLSDYWGKKIVLVKFRRLDNLWIDLFFDLKKENPALNFIFVGTNPYRREFEENTKSLELPGELFHVPGYGSNHEQAYYYNGWRSMEYYLIDQYAMLWGSHASKTQDKAFKKEAR
ncbi:MAG: hypothetical protein AAF696_32660, partial [Bacteroidota bacterium]